VLQRLLCLQPQEGPLDAGHLSRRVCPALGPRPEGSKGALLRLAWCLPQTPTFRHSGVIALHGLLLSAAACM